MVEYPAMAGGVVIVDMTSTFPNAYQEAWLSESPSRSHTTVVLT